MRVIILAAGQGKRMLPLTEKTPKFLLPLGEETLLSRLLGQLLARGMTDITVAVGFHKEQTIKEIEKLGSPPINIVENDRYEEDINILSLTLALGKRIEPFIVFESDVILDNAAFKKVLDVSDGSRSYWYTIGSFLSNQMGGICKVEPDGMVSDVQVIDKYYPKYKGYRKLIGLLTVGRNEVELYSRLLSEGCRQTTRQYYLTPWINNISRLRCYGCDLAGHKAVAINTPDEYREALKLFAGDETKSGISQD